jgi:hypothetical protein
VEQVPFGDQHQPVRSGQTLQRLAHAADELHRMLQHRLARVQDRLDLGAVTRPSDTSIAVSIIERVNPLTP